MAQSTLYTLIDIVFIDRHDGVQYIATPGQCYLYSDNIASVAAAAGVWLYTGMQTPDGKFYLDNAGGAYTAYELATVHELNQPLGYPGGIRMCYAPSAYEAARNVVTGEASFPIFEQMLGVNDFMVMTSSAKTADYVPVLPKLYAKYSDKAAAALKATDADIVEMYDGTNGHNRNLERFIRTPIPVIMESFYTISKRNKMTVRDCISAWNLAFHRASLSAGRHLYIGWDPNPVYPTKNYRVSRAEYENYKNDASCGFITPRIKIKSHAMLSDPFKHIDRYRAAIDASIRSQNALHVKPMALY